MNANEAVVELLGALNVAGVPYMVVGSFSSNFYGVPRSTNDADLVIDADSPELARALNSLGPHFQRDRQITFEMVTGTKRNVIRLEGTAFEIELFRLSDDPHDQERFRRRKLEKILGCDAFIPTPEDVIVTKLRWIKHVRRNKDIDDARDVIAVQANRVDWAYVYSWADVHGTREVLEEIRGSIPPI